MQFDAAKRDASLQSRGLDMARSDEVFAGVTLHVDDDRQDYGEDRFIAMGFPDGRMVVLLWTLRNNTTRIISMREANEREQGFYEPRF